MKIWKKQLFKETIQFIFFFLIALYLLYFLVDFSLNSTSLLSLPKKSAIFYYYLHHFLLRIDLFLPLSLLFAMIKVLMTMNQHNELVSLQMAGISPKKLMSPFFLIAFFLASFCYINYEFITPSSASITEGFQKSHIPKKEKKTRVHVKLLKDGSRLIYQKQLDTHQLFDLFWIRNKEDIWHCKYLHIDPTSHPWGEFVDHLIKGENGFQKKESFPKYSFENMTLHEMAKSLPMEQKPLRKLIKQFYSRKFSSNKDKAMLSTTLYVKLAKPLFSFLIVIGLFPFCIRFSRHVPIFMTTALSILFFVTFFTLIDAATILGENQVLSPAIAIWAPFALLFMFFLIRAKKQV